MENLTRPNLLFLFSDQHARHVTGCYGNAAVATPHLDRLASGGLVFDNAYCPSPICVPSRMSMLTGCYPSQQDCWTNDDFLASDRATWLHAAAAADYRPTLVGRLHAMGPDQLHGYAERAVGDHSPNWAGIARHSLGVLENTNDPHRVSLTASGIGQSAYEVKDVETTDAACAALDRLAQSAVPFCLSVGFILPHPPYVARQEDYARYATSVGLPRLAVPADEHPWLAWWRRDRGIADATADEILRARRAYFGLVTRLDAMIGQILDRLDALGLARNTLVVYTSDHGDQLGERGLWWKHTFYEESVAVPLIVRWPDALAAGERRNHIVNLTDVSATMLEALGAPALPNAAGRSFLGAARNAGAAWQDETFSEYCTDTVPAWTGGQAVRQRMVRKGAWKLVYYHGYAPQLFDLASDPDELRDRAADPACAQIRADLTRRVLAGWDPDEIERRMRRRRADKDLIGAWARKTAPGDQYRWDARAAYNRLDGTPAS